MNEDGKFVQINLTLKAVAFKSHEIDFVSSDRFICQAGTRGWRYSARGTKSPVTVANYAGPKYFRSDFVRREMERRAKGEVGKWEDGKGHGRG